MRAIREILRQRHEFHRSLREISRSLGVSYGAVQELVSRADRHGLTWPLPEDADDRVLEAVLYRSSDALTGRALPDMAAVERELKSHKGMTLMLAWQEYKAGQPDGYQYSQFCLRYRQWQKTQDPVMRQHHRFGAEAHLDFVGVTVPYTNPDTGEVLDAHIFTACLPASAYVSAHALAAEGLREWVLGTCLAFEDFGAVPESIRPDNPKAAVAEPSRYEPLINPTYLEMAQHYGVYVDPARPRRPRDKAAAETAVQNVERWVLAPLRHRRFFSVDEIEAAVQEGVATLNRRPFQKREGCRLSVFESEERLRLHPLPPTRYDFAVWKKARVSIDYHVEADKVLYSVPYHLIHQQVDVRVGTSTVSVFHRGRQVAMHVRSARRGAPVTDFRHMPSSHRRHAEWTPSRIIEWAVATGPRTAELVKAILASRPHPEMGFRSCLGIIRLARRYSPERLEAACARALAIHATSYRSVHSILKKGLDHLPLPKPESRAVPSMHQNIRGAAHFAQEVHTS